MDSNRITEFRIDAHLCDSAVVADGKLYVHGGGWSSITARRFPCRHPRIGLAVIVTVPYTATNQTHSITIQLEDEDKNQIHIGSKRNEDEGKPGQLDAQFNMGRPPHIHPGDAQNLPFAVNIDGVEFPSPGLYAFSMSIDGTPVHRLPFRLMGPAGMNIGT